MTDLTGIIYDNENLYWGYDTGEWSEVVSNIEYYSSGSILCITFIVYLATVVTIILMVCSSVIIIFIYTIFQKSSITLDKRFLIKRELLLLIQSFVIFFYAIGLIFCWHFYAYFLPDSPWTPIAINIFWILFGALNPILYLSMNRFASLNLFYMQIFLGLSEEGF